MNLIARITLLFVVVSLLVFGIGGVISYRILMREVKSEQQRFLEERLTRMEGLLERRRPTDTIRWSKLIVVPLQKLQAEARTFSDTLVMHSQLNRMEPHLRLDAIKNVEGKSYSISLYDVIIEEDDIRDGITESLTTMYLILLTAVLVIGFAASYFILRPFNLTLAEIKRFSLRNPHQRTSFPSSRVTEFKKLNSFLTEMTDKVKRDYQSLKEFSENASHEFQTPIAIVQSKLEVLLDDESLSETQIEQLSSIQNAVRRLSNMSNSLALLTKIENNEFINVEKIDINALLSSLLDEFKELLDLKQLSLKASLDHEVHLEADQVLIELMFTNLMNNAIRHNWEGGHIEVKLLQDQVMISNSGPGLKGDPKELFQRFKKSNQSSASMGLGLAIVKKICDFYAYEINYGEEQEIHTIHIRFEPLTQS